MKNSEAINLIQRELTRAKCVHPNFPDDPSQMVMIMVEEAGETVQAVNNWMWHGGDRQHIIDELIQTACVCVRILEKL